MSSSRRSHRKGGSDVGAAHAFTEYDRSVSSVKDFGGKLVVRLRSCACAVTLCMKLLVIISSALHLLRNRGRAFALAETDSALLDAAYPIALISRSSHLPRGE